MAGSIGDKSLKVRFEVDESSVRSAKRAIEEITRSLKELNKEAGGTIGGASTGGANISHPGVIGRVVGKVLTGSQGPGKGPNTGDALGIQNIRRMSEDTNSALRSMTNSVRDAVNNQIRELDRLKNAVNGVSGAYSGAAGGFGGSGGGGYGIGGYGPPGAGGLPGSGGGRGYPMGTPNISSVNTNNPFIANNPFQLAANAIGIPTSQAGLVNAAYNIANQGTKAYMESSTRMALEAPMLMSNRNAAIGGSIGQMGTDILGGNITKQFFWQQARKGIMGKQMPGTTLAGMTAAQNEFNTPGGIVSRLMSQRRAEAATDQAVLNAAGGGFIGTAFGGGMWDMYKGTFNAPADVAQQVAQSAENLQRANPLTARALGRFSENLNQRVDLMNLYGQGWGMKEMEIPGMPGLIQSKMVNLTQTRLNTIQQKHQLRSESVIQAGQGLLPFIGQRALGGLDVYTAMKTEGQFLNAPGIIGAAAQFGRGGSVTGPGTFLGQIMGASSVGGGTFDPVTKSALAQAALSLRAKTITPTSGMGITQAVGALAGGLPAGAAMQMIEMSQQGIGAWNRIAQGGLDPLSGVISARAGMAAAPGAAYGMQSLLGLASADDRAAAARGEMPAWAKETGLSPENFAAFDTAAGKMNILGRVPMASLSPALQSRMTEFASAGGLKGLYKQRLAEGGEAGASARELVQQYTPIAMQAYRTSPEEAQKILAGELGLTAGQLGLKGGVGRASKGTAEGANIGAGGEAAGVLENELDPETLKQLAKARVQEAQNLEDVNQGLQKVFGEGSTLENVDDMGKKLGATLEKLNTEFGKVTHFVTWVSLQKK